MKKPKLLKASLISLLVAPLSNALYADDICRDHIELPKQSVQRFHEAKLLPPIGAAVSKRHDKHEHEILALSDSMTAAQALNARLAGSSLRLLRRHELANIGLVISVYRAPPDSERKSLLAALDKRAPASWSSNAVYRSQGTGYASDMFASVNWPRQPYSCGSGIRVGAVDTLADDSHPALAGQNLIQHSVLPAGVIEASDDHGTALATLLVGRGESQTPGLLPKGQLHIASGFANTVNGEAGITTERLLLAIEKLADANTQVINLSLAGPQNPVLSKSLARLHQKGYWLVAAAGNFGPRAEPAYPAALDSVIAVTAVDIEGGAFGKSNRGDYVELSAPGVDVFLGRRGGKGKYYSGTSFAAPFVTASIAAAQQRGASGDKLRTLLHNSARDLGEPGFDAVYGWGHLHHPQAGSGCP